jgi:probable O-glycosylation ligase (exosortase A-associated)
VSTAVTGRKFKFNQFTAFLLIIAVQSFISTLLSSHFDICFSYWVNFLKVLVVSYLITILVTSERELKIVFLLIALSLGFEGAKQGWANMVLNPGAPNNNEIPFLGDNNCVAVGMLMLVPIFRSLFPSINKRIFKIGFIIMIVGVVYRALSTYSRGGFLSFCALCVMWWFRSKNKLISLIAIILIAAIILPIFPQSFWDRMGTISTDENKTDRSAFSRVHFWKVGFDMALNNPLFGVGVYGYKYEFDKYDYTHGEYGTGRSVHSMWFGILSELGFIGMILFLGIYFYSWYMCTATRKKCRNIPELSYLANYSSAIEVGLVVCAIGGTFLPFQYVEMLWHYFALSSTIYSIANASYLSMEVASSNSDAPSRLKFNATNNAVAI